MPDPSRHDPSSFDADPAQTSALEARLDALGRALVSDEARRVQPSSEFVAAVARRGTAAAIRTWTPRLALAAGLLALIVYLILRTSGTPQSPPTPPSKPGDDTGRNTSAGAATPTFGWLWVNNRDVSVADLRLPSGAASAADKEPSSAVDSRHPDRVNHLLRSP